MHRPRIWPATALALAACACAPGSAPPDTSPGVSRQLAAHRARVLSRVRYEVALTVPESTDERVSGRVVIHFTRRDPAQALVLDFSAPPGSVTGVARGDQPLAFEHAQEHLIVPAEALRRGADSIAVTFLAGDGALNRNAEFLYTLFVPDRASSAFPCFDQPDLKARYRLTLRVPVGWEAVSNMPVERRDTTGRVATVVFRETPPLSTYVFAFAAGRFAVEEAERSGRLLRMYHRETDAARVARNRDAIFDLHDTALRWLEAYTAIRYPFEKFEFVAVPAFQYGGMEHPGAVLYRASALFLDEAATQSQRLGRASLIAHETAHMWFGDLVTMRWFDDVWMKEVFANFMAAKIVNPSFPEIDHDLRFFLAHHPTAYGVDRTAGANAIRQPLENLREAGTLYGAIIYQKAPIVMRHLERLIGEAAMRDGLRTYLDRFRFDNASWPDLIAILDRRTPEDLAAWSRAWVEQPGRPAIEASVHANGPRGLGGLSVEQRDPRGRGRRWPQRLALGLRIGDSLHALAVDLDGWPVAVADARGLPPPAFVLPGADGLGYGSFALSEAHRLALAAAVPLLRVPVARSVGWLTLWEAVLYGELAPDEFVRLAMAALPVETDQLIVQQILGDVEAAFWRFLHPAGREALAGDIEALLWREVARADGAGAKRAYFDALVAVTTTPEGTGRLERVWNRDLPIAGLPLEERQYTALAEALALRDPSDAGRVLEAQLGRIANPDRRARFRFVMPSLSPDPAVRDSVFASLADVRNRRHEPWVLDALGYLNHALRAAVAERYLRASLELVEEVQRTGDIFFPLRWLHATLDGHQSAAAAETVLGFLGEHPEYPARLRGKILQAADPLFRSARIVHGWTGADSLIGR